MASAERTEPDFEQALGRLEEIVHLLEQGDEPLERSLALFEEAMRLAGLCSQRLAGAEGKLEQLVEQGGAARTEPLELGELRSGSVTAEDDEP